MKKYYLFGFLLLAFQIVTAQESWLKHIPIPKPEILPHYTTIYEDEKSIDFPKKTEGKTFQLKFKITEAKFEGRYTDILIGNKTYSGLVGEVKFKNGDSYKGTLFFNWRRRFSDGVYTKKMGEKIHFFENGEPFNTLKYQFKNGDSLVVNRSKQEGNSFYELGTYYYQDGSTLDLSYSNANGYAGPVEYKGSNGSYVQGKYLSRNEPGGFWKIINDGTLTYLNYSVQNNCIGTTYLNNEWNVIYNGIAYKATKLNEFTFCFDGNCHNGAAKLLINKENQRGVAEVNFLNGKIQNPVDFIFYDDFYLMKQYALKANLNKNNLIDGICDFQYLNHFHFTEPCQFVYKNGNIIEAKYQFKNGDVYTTFNPLDENEAYIGNLKFANGHRYEGTVNKHFLPEKKGIYYFNDVDYIDDKLWSNGKAVLADLYKNNKKQVGIYSFDVTNKKLEERHITISFEPTVQPKKAESNRRFYKCPTCTGSGNSFMVCPGCGGAGYNSKATLVYRQGGTDKCVYCKGSGRYPVASCGTCHGTGEVYQD
jgi:hypothetical protein